MPTATKPPTYLSFIIHYDDSSSFSSPVYVADADPNRQITLVLPLTLDDVARCYLLLNSLREIDTASVAELLIIVPEIQIAAISSLLTGQTNPFPLRFIAESSLFRNYTSLTTYPYAIQMALKLLAAQVISTHHYLTLDADILFLNDISLSKLITNDKAIYQHEERNVHASWWLGSQRLLQIPSVSDRGISVTPVLMSSFGALITLQHLEMLYGQEYQTVWLNSFGQVLWSEYTMYLLTLDYYQV